MNLEDLGYSPLFDKYRKEHNLNSFEVARVTAEHRERYIVQSNKALLEAEITGSLRFTAKERSDFPAVGDWVAIFVFDDQSAVIHDILPRKSILQRKSVGEAGEKQIIATNIDYAFIVMAVDRDFNLNRLERYLTISLSGNVTPILLLSKIDLITNSELQDKIDKVKQKNNDVKIIPFSNKLLVGYLEIMSEIKKYNTYCVMGSSGVGKSTLINHLVGKEIMTTGKISTSTNKGRHVTSHRELVLLENGGILIDTPGMREVGIVEGVEESFDYIDKLAHECKFNNCRHIDEKGCAIIDALERKLIDYSSYNNYLKLKKESHRIQTSIAEKRKRNKTLGKMYKNYLKHKNKF